MLKKSLQFVARLVSSIALFLAGLPGIPPEDSGRRHREPARSPQTGGSSAGIVIVLVIIAIVVFLVLRELR